MVGSNKRVAVISSRRDMITALTTICIGCRFGIAGLAVIMIALAAPVAALPQDANSSPADAIRSISKSLPYYYAWQPKWRDWPVGIYASATAGYTIADCALQIKITNGTGRGSAFHSVDSTYLLEGGSYPGEVFPGTVSTVNDEDVSVGTLNFRDVDISSLHVVKGDSFSSNAMESVSIFFLGDRTFSFPFDSEADARRTSAAFVDLARKCGAQAPPSSP